MCVENVLAEDLLATTLERCQSRCFTYHIVSKPALNTAQVYVQDRAMRNVVGRASRGETGSDAINFYAAFRPGLKIIRFTIGRIGPSPRTADRKFKAITVVVAWHRCCGCTFAREYVDPADGFWGGTIKILSSVILRTVCHSKPMPPSTTVTYQARVPLL